ncbi:MAG TPA: ABC transporter substrate-binding protein [Actinomycetota bacterium]|nr:ABC transporter substrate-binding protein [Actinomycetota bacterium]
MGISRRPTLIALLAILGCLAGGLPSSSAAPGVNGRRIKIGIHAPVTGAVPLPSDSVDRAARLYWRWLRHKDQTINRRNVRVVLRNDQSNPSTAVAVCKELVEEHNVFLLAGTLQSGLPYQSHACARYAESVGVPYVALGGQEGIVRSFNRYFAITATLRKQARLLADLFVERLRGRRRTNGVVWINDPAFAGAHNAFARALERRNADVDYDRTVARNAGTTEARLIVEEMRLAEVDNVFFIHTPIFFLNVLKQADTQGFEPRWTGVGPGIGGNDEVARTACGGGATLDGAKFLSALPAFLDRDRFDRRHDRAMNAIYPQSEGNDTTWLGWATSKALRKMLERPGRRLTRARFARRVERARIRTGILPTIRFRPRDHFGGRGVHVLTARCKDRRWHTTNAFVTDF